MNPARAAFERRLGHAFNDPGLLDSALTHRSAQGVHNERLEFLGDAVLNLVIARAVYELHPDADEGDLTRLRATLVRAETLARVAEGLAIGECLVLGGGELKSGGYRRESILGDALEAVIGAVFLDSGFEAARAMVLSLFEERLATTPEPDSLKDAKTRLQEYLQGRQLGLPAYELLSTEGDPHARTFIAECRVDALGVLTRGSGTSRRAAEQEAAAAALDAIDA